MVTGDSAYIKKINRSSILKKIIEEGMISRADLSKATNLTRATISVQVADLLEEGLVIETQHEHNTVGRKPIMLSLNGNSGYALGIDLDYGHISFTVSNLLGYPISSKTIELETAEYQEILSILIKQINAYKDELSDSLYGITGIVIGIHGLVSNSETIHYVPRFQWKNISLAEDIKKEVGINTYIENNANLCALAERVYVYHDTHDLLCASIYSGIGLGLMMDNDFFQGYNGFAGEVGHMIVVPGGKPCNCGNLGCWEQYASESSFFKQLSKEKNIKKVTYDQVEEWISEGDEIVKKLLDNFIYYLSIGVNNMINFYNPDVVVINSELLQLYPNSTKLINENLNSSISDYQELSLSTLGKNSCGMGACALAIKHFLDVPMLNLRYDEENNKLA